MTSYFLYNLSNLNRSLFRNFDTIIEELLLHIYFHIIFHLKPKNVLYFTTRIFGMLLADRVWKSNKSNASRVFAFASAAEYHTFIVSNLERVKEGIGDKLALLIQYTSQFLAGFVIAFIYNWKLTLIMMSLSPFMILCGAFIAKVFYLNYANLSDITIYQQLMASATEQETAKYAKAGGIAEEVLTSIRTVIAFNGQNKENERSVSKNSCDCWYILLNVSIYFWINMKICNKITIFQVQ